MHADYRLLAQCTAGHLGQPRIHPSRPESFELNWFHLFFEMNTRPRLANALTDSVLLASHMRTRYIYAYILSLIFVLTPNEYECCSLQWTAERTIGFFSSAETLKNKETGASLGIFLVVGDAALARGFLERLDGP